MEDLHWRKPSKAGIYSMRIIISTQAKKDMVYSYKYLKNDLLAPKAAEDLKNSLEKAIRSLETFPQKGVSLNNIIDYTTDYCFLVKDNHYIFYKIISNDELNIIRVLHTRQNIIRALFSE